MRAFTSWVAFVSVGLFLCYLARNYVVSAGLNPLVLDVAIIALALIWVRVRVRVTVRR